MSGLMDADEPRWWRGDDNESDCSVYEEQKILSRPLETMVMNVMQRNH